MGTATKELPACPVETTLTLISDKWKVLILRDLLPGTKSSDRSAARDGEQRTSYPNCLCGGSSQGGIYTDGFGVQLEAHSGRHVELGRELQGAEQLSRKTFSDIFHRLYWMESIDPVSYHKPSYHPA